MYLYDKKLISIFSEIFRCERMDKRTRGHVRHFVHHVWCGTLKVESSVPRSNFVVLTHSISCIRFVYRARNFYHDVAVGATSLYHSGSGRNSVFGMFNRRFMDDIPTRDQHVAIGSATRASETSGRIPSAGKWWWYTYDAGLTSLTRTSAVSYRSSRWVRSNVFLNFKFVLMFSDRFLYIYNII